ncbi:MULTISPECIES: phasin [unclassified Mesorhizobium]|uniref:phasin n=1 Tax=unclassified Mesorhizobium TaxID=325217 RepID=UPI000BB0BC5D|nr:MULTISPECIES: phasin [unclassified Mesorhizobium]TGT61021.1 phasin [Mesorhizobium sp. M00.F.Ca.ET.170.01.1.1]AZO08791.1 phasin [Mesorhizobium sp. M3A.F.Ca.ET.080.04.2.1]PBB84062.1 phasin [Mesorhizobium sp. WSM3876]RWB65545.1 MAG: phasin [Mesorhizobium sp.]RWB83710.1 MAG: phasin [Mesorhizobium sp.]
MSKTTGKTETIENVESVSFDPSKATEQVRAVAEQGVEQAKEAFSKLQSDAETTQKALESSFELAKTSRNEVSLKTIAALRANTEAGFTHLEALVAAKSPSEFLELQSAFLNKQIETSIEQAKTLQALMLRAAEDVSKPIKDAFEKVLRDLKAA